MAAGSALCIDCIAGKYVDVSGSDEVVDCIDCIAGTYVDVAGSDEASDCIDCPVGKYIDLAGSNDPLDCIDCRAGTYIDVTGGNQASDCIDCVLGKYVDVVGSDELSDCIDCIAGKYIDVTGSNEASDCINCIAGRYIDVSGSDAASDCIDCVIGKYIDVTGSDQLSDCISCVSGTYIDVTGSDHPSDCIACISGHYTHELNTGDGLDAGASSCSVCPEGRFNPVADAECDLCPVGSNTSQLTGVPNVSGCVCADAPCGTAAACGYEGTLSQETRQCSDVSPPSIACHSRVLIKSWASPHLTLSELLVALTDNSQRWLSDYPNNTATQLQVSLSEGTWIQDVGTSTAHDLLAISFPFDGPVLPVRTTRNITVTARDHAGLNASCVAPLYLEAPEIASSAASISATTLSTTSSIVEVALTNVGEQELRITVLGTRVLSVDGHPPWCDVHFRHLGTVIQVGTEVQHMFVLCPPGGCTSIASESSGVTVLDTVTLMITLDGARTLAAGSMNATLEVESNDPSVPAMQIEISLDVQELPIVAMVAPVKIDLTLVPNEVAVRPMAIHNVYANIDGVIQHLVNQCSDDCTVLDPTGTRPAIDVGQGVVAADIVRQGLATACSILPEDSPCPHDWSRVRDSGNIVVVHENCTCDTTTTDFPCVITPTPHDFSGGGGMLRTTRCSEVLDTGDTIHKSLHVRAPELAGTYEITYLFRSTRTIAGQNRLINR